ncbi:hypothetical protein SAMN04489761_0294 [Tenacibaculum sp. MAR_2009_124]|uniref:DUF6768 family protein n=1 Tax=Tenacibaculum sp. MAR_2009_124 TaxID=1250059 RepID=UPI000899495D|nr:DUF6768 family protein [Tenacibaculum sp. MAR_2009_124]SEB37947.1 hypothetical protein SAMN04489761_0294 [Tenacibaculum sp. MAR_2009_124]
MKDIEEIDKLIKETLSEEEAKFYEELDEQNVFQMIQGLFKGKNKWIMVLMNIMTVVFFVFFMYCLIQFFQAEEIKELIKWAGGSIIFLLGVSMLKIFAWLQMDKNAVLREIKRLEIQISSISSKISS